MRQHASTYLALVKAGEVVEVTERGELIALLSPPSPARSARERLLASGGLVPAVSPTGQLRSGRPVPVAPGEPTNQELLDDLRREGP